jgi:hypothetical protein
MKNLINTIDLTALTGLSDADLAKGIAALIILVVVFAVLRYFYAWLFRINEVLRELKEINEHLRVLRSK